MIINFKPEATEELFYKLRNVVSVIGDKNYNIEADGNSVRRIERKQDYHGVNVSIYVDIDVPQASFLTYQDDVAYQQIYNVTSLICNSVKNANIDDIDHPILARQIVKSYIRGNTVPPNAVYFEQDLERVMLFKETYKKQLEMRVSSYNIEDENTTAKRIEYYFSFI